MKTLQHVGRGSTKWNLNAAALKIIEGFIMAMLESGEDYIETIYRLKKKNGVVYSIDVARELGFSRPSVSRAMSILREEEYITMDEVSKEINLTEKGRKKAVEVYDRHKTLTAFL